MAEQPTCGQGLAYHAALPLKLGELTASVAESLELHTRALDLTDEDSTHEHDAYVSLVREHRATAAQLLAIGNEMAGYRNLPMGKHDMQVMRSPRIFETFENYVKVEQELLTLLQTRIEQDRRLLGEMRAPSRS